MFRKFLDDENVSESMRNLHRFIKVSPMGETEFAHAFQSIRPKAEYTLQYYSAWGAACNVVMANNKKHFPQNDNMPMMTAARFPDHYFTLE